MSQGIGSMLRKGILAAAIAGVVLGGTVTSQAANIWDGGGGDNNWNTANNWDDNQVPAFPAPVTFAGLTRLTPINNISNPLVRGITFDPSAGSFNLSGGAITLNATTVAGTTTGGVTDNTVKENNGGIKLSSLALSNVNLPISLAAGRHVFTTDTGAGSLAFSGVATRQAGSNVNFIVNGGNIITSTGSGFENDATGILGGWATVGTDPTLSGFASRDLSGNIVPYLYPVANVFGSDAFPAGTTLASNLNFIGGGPLTIPSGAQANTLLFSEQTTTIDTMTVTDTLTFANGGGIFRSGDAVARHVLTGGTMTAGTSGPATLYLRQRTSAAPDPGTGPPEALDILTQITDNAGGGAVTVVKSGFGVTRWSPAAGNTFTGGLYVNEGQLRPTTVGSLGAASSSIYVADGAQVLVNTVSKIDNPWFIKGFGPQEQGGVVDGEFRGGAIRLNNAGIEIAGTVTLQADASIGARGGQTASTATNAQFVSGKITGPYSLRLNRQNTQGTAGITSSMPTIRLTNSGNDWTGKTEIGRGRLTIGTSGVSGEVIPDGPGFGNVEMVGEAISETILNLNGNTETINGLSSSGDESLIVITNHLASTTGTLRVGNNNQTSTFGGRFIDDTSVGGLVSVTKIGSGALTLTDALSTWGGNTRVDGGTLSLPALTGGLGLADAANVLIGSSGILNLNFTGTDDINFLYLNGLPQAVGTYGRIGNPGSTIDTALITGDGVLNVLALGPPLAGVTGDYNNNGVVDAADYVMWREALVSQTALQNDPLGLPIDEDQYNQWKANFGNTPGSGSALGSTAVPEPATATIGLILAAAMCGLMSRRRPRRGA